MSANNFFVRWLHVVTLAILVVTCLYGSAAGQTPPPATTPRPQQPASPSPRTQAPPRAPARTTMVFIHVRNADGRPLPGVHLVVSGAASRDVMTDFEGLVRLQMTDGAYQLRFELDGFVSLEKELTLRNGAPDVVDVTLNAVPAPPPPPPPVEPPPPPEPPPPLPPAPQA